MSVPTLEELFRHRDFWSVTTATPVQRAACRIIDGLPLGDLAASEDVRWMVGGEAALAALEPGGPAPRQVSLYGAVRIGKSDLASCLAFRASQTIDVSLPRAHELIRIPVLSLTIDTARVTFDHLIGRLHGDALRPLLVKEGADFVIVRHPSGREVEIKVVAGARAGGSLIARWNGGAIFDEKPRMLGSADGAIVNYDDALSAVEGRLLPGAQVIDLGSPWAPWGPAYEDIDKKWGKPTRHHVVLRMTGPMANPSWWTPARMAELQQKNPRAYVTDALGEFAQSETSVFRVEWIDDAQRLGGVIASASTGRALDVDFMRSAPVAVLDVASGKKDTFAHGLLRWVRIDARKYAQQPDGAFAFSPPWELRREAGEAAPMILSLDHVGGIGGRFFETVSGDAIFDKLAAEWKRAGVRKVVGDQRESLMVKAAVERRGFRFFEVPWTATSKVRGIETLQRLLAEKRFAIEKHDRLRHELSTFRQVVNAAGGFTFGARGNGSDDFVALCLTGCLADLEGHIGSSPNRPQGGGPRMITTPTGIPFT